MSPKVESKTSRASVWMGVLDGVRLVLGWMVRKWILRFWEWPMTVLRKSTVRLRLWSDLPVQLGRIGPRRPGRGGKGVYRSGV